MKNERIHAIYDASVQLFLQQGYSKTQISHIARKIGVSVGTIYHDFTGKEEIMHFLLKCTLDPDFIERDFERPITEELFWDLDQEIKDAFESIADEFGRNLEHAGTSYGFEDLISDAFDLMSRYAVGCLFIEKNLMDCGRLIQYYTDYRKQFFDTMSAYMESFIQTGIIRSLKSVKLSTSLIIETLSWWAMDVRYVTFEKQDISPEEAKEVCMDNMIHAYKK